MTKDELKEFEQELLDNDNVKNTFDELKSCNFILENLMKSYATSCSESVNEEIHEQLQKIKIIVKILLKNGW